MGEGVTRKNLDILIAHLVQSPEVLRIAATRLDPDRDYTDTDEQMDKLVWSVARAFWVKYGQAPRKDYLLAELDKVVKPDPAWSDPTLYGALVQFVERAYMITESELLPHFAIGIMQELLDERRIGWRMQAMQSSGTPVEEIVDTITREFASTRVDIPEAQYVGMPGHEVMGSEESIPTGLPFFDSMQAGNGPSKGDLIGILGPTGGGKTLVCTQIIHSVAQIGHRSALLLYEQPLKGNAVERLYALMAHKMINDFKGKELEDLPPDVLEPFREAQKQYGHMFQYFDMSGTYNHHGAGGPAEVESIIVNLKTNGQMPTFVIIDWLYPMVQRWMAGKADDSGSMSVVRNVINYFIVQLKLIASRHNVIIIVTHQLDTATQTRKPGNKPQDTDAMECKSFSFMMPYVFAIGNKTKEDLCWWICAKGRGSAGGDRVLQMVDGLVFKEVNPAELLYDGTAPRFREGSNDIPTDETPDDTIKGDGLDPEDIESIEE